MKIDLTKADIEYLVDELCNANESENFYLTENFNDIGEEEEKELNANIAARSKLITKLTKRTK